MSPFIAEFLGTLILILLGTSVVANVTLPATHAQKQGSPFLMITTGWAWAVFCGVALAAPYSGAHLNPAVSLGLVLAGRFDAQMLPIYLAAQMAGAIAGAALTYIFYWMHIRLQGDEAAIRGCFCNAPALTSVPHNLFSEALATAVLVGVALFLAGPKLEIVGQTTRVVGLGSVGALPVALLVWGIGLSLGGTTGYAINPARDLAPRLVYVLFRGKKAEADWSYAWIPVVGPLLGAALVGLLYSIFIG
ncbi:MAG: aquaporin family protein [Sphingomonadales bacterium]|nr:aquaporin family protein [Sphingomonadales bacterium]